MPDGQIQYAASLFFVEDLLKDCSLHIPQPSASIQLRSASKARTSSQEAVRGCETRYVARRWNMQLGTVNKGRTAGVLANEAPR